jgi:glycosyltransferase involved in cell wall biosynthesis
VNNHINLLINQEGLRIYESKILLSGIKKNIKIISVIHNSPLGILKSYGITFSGKSIKLIIKRHLLFLYTFFIYRQIFNSLINNSNIILLLSNHYKKDFQFFVKGKCSKKLYAIPNPVPFQFVEGNKKKENILLFVGRIDNKVKQIDVLLQIWKNVYDDFQDWKLIIIGDGKDLEINIDIAKKMKITNIFFEGYQNPVPFYEQASVFCMTSVFEGFPMVLIEAMNFGVIPFAFSSFSAVTDIIDQNINGIIIPPFNIDEYILQLKLLMSNKEKQNKMSNAAIQKARDFDIDKIGIKWMNMINNLDKINV